MTTTTAGASIVEGTDGALPIVPVWLQGPSGTIKTNALLGTGASRSLMEEELAAELGLDGKGFKFNCRGFGGALSTHPNSKSVEVAISGYYHGAKFSKLKNVITVGKIGVAPYSLDLKEAKKQWPCLHQMKGRSMRKAVPRIIIGSPHRHLTIPREILSSHLEGPVATRTILGWVLEGNLNGSGAPSMYYMAGSREELDLSLHNLIKESFRNEDFDIRPSTSRHTIEDQKALQIMEKTTVKIGDRWETGLLWRDEDIKLPNSYDDTMKTAENIANSRPMTYLSSDVDDPGALTSNQFEKAGAIAADLWKRWADEYLPTLLQREKWTDQVEPLDVGDLVLIVDDQLPRNCWVKAVVTATFPAKDGHVRAVEVTTRDFSTKKKNTLKRPVTKLCPLGLKIGKSDVITSNLL